MKRLFGGILLAGGILLMGVSGLCSAAVIIGSLSGGGIRDPSILLLPLIVGGLPMAIGFAMFRWGRQLIREANENL